MIKAEKGPKINFVKQTLLESIFICTDLSPKVRVRHVGKMFKGTVRFWVAGKNQKD